MRQVDVKKATPYYFTEKDTLWLSTPQFGKQGLTQFDVAYTGYTHIFVIQMARFMEMMRPQLTESMRIMLERAATSFSGPGNMTLETADVTDGIAANTLRVATKSTRDTTDITIRVLEMAGLPGREFAKEYIRGMNDPHTQVRTYLGANLEKSMINETFIFLIVQSDPSLEVVQDSAMYVNCVLTEHDRSHLSWEKGGISVIEGTEFRFTCTELVNDEVTEMAKNALANRRAIINPDSFKATIV